MYKTVMCVDDEVNLLKLYQQVLTDEGYQVLPARTIGEAKGLLEMYPIDLIVLDIKMENENGLDLLAELKRFHPEIPVILNSAFNTYKADFKSWMANEFVVKSSDFGELKSKIGNLLQ